MLIFISGGCKNGKSGRAQQIAMKMSAPGKPLYYIAAMRPVDAEDDARIARHREERKGMSFTTVECQEDIPRLAESCDVDGCFLIDSVTALLMNSMFPLGKAVDRDAPIKLRHDFEELLPRLSRAVIVSDYIYSDAALYDDLTETYRRGLASVDRTVASLCDVVIEATAGNLVLYKGADIFAGEMGAMEI